MEEIKTEKKVDESSEPERPMTWSLQDDTANSDDFEPTQISFWDDVGEAITQTWIHVLPQSAWYSIKRVKNHLEIFPVEIKEIP